MAAVRHVIAGTAQPTSTPTWHGTDSFSLSIIILRLKYSAKAILQAISNNIQLNISNIMGSDPDLHPPIYTRFSFSLSVRVDPCHAHPMRI